MIENITPEINRRRRKKLLNICFTVLAGYVISQIGTFAARWLDLTRMDFMEIGILSSTVIFGTLFFIIVVRLKRNITKKFANIIFILQSIFFVCMYTIWVYKLNEIRMLGLFFALVALTFELSFTTLKQSLVISLSTTIMQISVSIYAINYAGQAGSLKHELFFSACFLPSFLIISYIARQAYRKQEIIKVSKKSLERANKELTRMNLQLERTQRSIRIDMKLAAFIQSSIFPKEPDGNSGWDIAYFFRPLLDVSGDFYDFYYREGRLKGLSLFDVSGHGVSSALLTMFAKPMIFRLFNAMEKDDLGRVMELANENIYHEIERTYNFITGVILRFNEGNVEYVNAGHTDIIHKRSMMNDAGIISEKKFKGNPVGIFEDNKYDTIKFRVEKNDFLFIYSDCLIESMNSGSEKYGMKRLLDTLKEAPDGDSKEVLDYIINRFNLFLDNNPVKDDLTIILAKRIS